MSFDKVLRQKIQEEIQHAIRPLTDAIAHLQTNDVASQLTALLGGAIKRGPGRPRKSSAHAPMKRAAKAGKPGRKAADRACAVIACNRPVRSKGYCAAHYQKRRMLAKTKRLPPDWKDNAPPHTVQDIMLPRGRAGAKALAAANKK